MPQSFFHQNLQFSRLFTKKLNEQLIAIGLISFTMGDCLLFKAIWDQHIVEISQYLDVEKPTVSRTVDRLEKAELIEKIPSKDKRERRIQLTKKALTVFHEANSSS